MVIDRHTSVNSIVYRAALIHGDTLTDTLTDTGGTGRDNPSDRVANLAQL
jgi:hypothetical protein